MNVEKTISGCCAKGEHDLCGGDSKFGFCQCHCHDAPVRYWKRKVKESEKELERVQKQAAAMRKALIYTENWLLGAHDEKGEIAPDYPLPHVQAALQPDAGSALGHCTRCGAPFAAIEDDNGLCVKCSLNPSPTKTAAAKSLGLL